MKKALETIYSDLCAQFILPWSELMSYILNIDFYLFIKCQWGFDVLTQSLFISTLLDHTYSIATRWLLTAFPSPRLPQRCQGAADGCQHRHQGTVGIPSRQAGCPDSNNNEEGIRALHEACALENVSDAICHLLRTSFYTCISIFILRKTICLLAKACTLQT